MIIPSIKTYVIYALSVLSVVLGLAAWGYRSAYISADMTLQLQNKAIEAQNKTAESELKKITAERDSIQDAYGVLAKTMDKDQRNFDEELQRLRNRPPAPGAVRVRVVPGTCGEGGDGPAGREAANSPIGPAAQTAATGLLAPAVVGRIDGVAFEVEELQRDFNTCQTYLLGLK